MGSKTYTRNKAVIKTSFEGFEGTMVMSLEILDLNQKMRDKIEDLINSAFEFKEKIRKCDMDTFNTSGIHLECVMVLSEMRRTENIVKDFCIGRMNEQKFYIKFKQRVNRALKYINSSLKVVKKKI